MENHNAHVCVDEIISDMIDSINMLLEGWENTAESANPCEMYKNLRSISGLSLTDIANELKSLL